MLCLKRMSSHEAREACSKQVSLLHRNVSGARERSEGIFRNAM